MPVAMISTSTSPALGPSRSSSTISSGCLGAKATAARVFMGVLPNAAGCLWQMLSGALGSHPSRFAMERLRAQAHAGIGRTEVIVVAALHYFEKDSFGDRPAVELEILAPLSAIIEDVESLHPGDKLWLQVEARLDVGVVIRA